MLFYTIALFLLILALSFPFRAPSPRWIEPAIRWVFRAHYYHESEYWYLCGAWILILLSLLSLVMSWPSLVLILGGLLCLGLSVKQLIFAIRYYRRYHHIKYH